MPLKSAYSELRTSGVTRFETAAPLFLSAMEEFDRLVMAGRTTQGDRQNGKGDFFNDVVALLLHRCSERDLHTRRALPGLIFRNHSLDVAYPARGEVRFTVETKAVGSPKHPGSTKQKPSGRPGSADLEKRIKEAAFKDIDIKGEQARRRGQGDLGQGDLSEWLRMNPPRNWLLISARARDETDLNKIAGFAQAASDWFDGCGLFVFGHKDWDLAKPYEVKQLPSTNIELDRVLHRVCTALRNDETRAD